MGYNMRCGIFPDPNKIETTMAKSKRLRKPVQSVALNVNWSAIFNEEFVINATNWKYDSHAINEVENGMDAWTIELFSPSECAKLIELCEMYGFEDAGYPQEYRSNTRLITQDDALADVLYERIKQCCPQKYKCDGGMWQICGLNERFRWCKYIKGQKFDRHYDGRFIRNSKEKSFYTVNIYMNDGYNDFGDGRTCFFNGQRMTSAVRACTGFALMFNHYPNRIEHNGEEVSKGIKYLMRTDVMYRLTDEETIYNWKNGPCSKEGILFKDYDKCIAIYKVVLSVGIVVYVCRLRI